MHPPESLKGAWHRDGYVHFPHLFSSEEISVLRTICDRVHQEWLCNSHDPEELANCTNMAMLTDLGYFSNHPDQLTTLLNLIADRRILDTLRLIFDRDLLFHNTQYFVEPRSQSWEGDWHRDQQFDAPDVETQIRRMSETIGIHVHIALVPEDHLEYVPGSHQRWDTPEEWEIRQGSDHNRRHGTMPNSVRLPLNPGDACFFDAWGIHRGHYRAGAPRRDLDIIYGTRPEWFTPPPTCFLDPQVMERLAPDTRTFFQRFIEEYQKDWEKSKISVQ